MWKFGNIFSLILVIVSVFSVIKKDINLGLDFTGGILMEIYSEDGFTREESVKLSSSLDAIHVKNLVQLSGHDRLLLKLQAENSTIDNVKNLISNDFKDTKLVRYDKIDFIGSQVSREFFRNSFYACIIAIFGIMIYLLFRFDWRFAIGGILGLVHDIVITFGFISITSLEVNMLAVTAILTVIGYSINDSVIIYDRIREVIRLGVTENFKQSVNLSLNDTLARTMFTSITTLLSIGVLIIFGGNSLYSFSCVVFVGIFIGTYSSVFIASQFLVYFPSNGTKKISIETEMVK